MSITTVLQLADIHYPAVTGGRVCDRDPHMRLQTVLDACVGTLDRVDLVLLTGDQTHHGDVAANRRLRELLAPIGAPILAAPGNHDDARSHHAVFGAAPSAIEIGTWRVLAWDTCVRGADYGSVDVAAFVSHIDELDDRPTVVAMHHPPVAPTNNPVFRLENAQDLLRALVDRSHVRAIVSGHAHVPFRREHDGRLLLGGPAVCVPFLHGDQGELTIGAGGPTGARTILLDDDGTLTSEVIEA
jgi:3',5'-cyclic-AMP phosphodiesterase